MRQPVRPRRTPRAVLWTTAAFVVGLTGAFLLGWRLPALEILAFALAFLLVVGTSGVLQAVVERRWVFWCALPATALTALAALMLAADVALLESGRPTEVVVAAHDVDVRHGGNGTTYTHTYTLEHPDGRPLGQDMTYRGKSGYDGVEEGTELTVLVDPSGEARPRPVDAVDVSAGVAVLVVGGLGLVGVLTGCVVSTRRPEPERPAGRGRHASPR